MIEPIMLSMLSPASYSLGCINISPATYPVSTLKRMGAFNNLLLLALFISFSSIQPASANLKLFREYIGAEDTGVTFSDIPIDSNVEVHFILSFAVDYITTNSSSSVSPTNGNFKVYWDTKNLNPEQVSFIKTRHSNVKIAMSLGGDTVGDDKDVYFEPTSIDSWVENAIKSLTAIALEYKLDGIDIDYEHFNAKANPDTFVECIGRLVDHLKKKGIISFASIAPFEDPVVQSHYLALWRKYSHLIDYVNFQFYAYDKGTNVNQFMKYFQSQKFNYQGAKLLVSFGTDGSGGLTPENGFFDACSKIKELNMLDGIFIWSADDSKKADHEFVYEKQAQIVLASIK